MMNAEAETASSFNFIAYSSWIVWKILEQHILNIQMRKIKILKVRKKIFKKYILSTWKDCSSQKSCNWYEYIFEVV